MGMETDGVMLEQGEAVQPTHSACERYLGEAAPAAAAELNDDLQSSGNKRRHLVILVICKHMFLIFYYAISCRSTDI